jgi:hypothetical protein
MYMYSGKIAVPPGGGGIRDDNECFAWSVVAALFPVNVNTDRISSYPHWKTVLKTDNLKFPISINEISKFEKLNNISINVYILELIQTKFKTYFNVIPARLTKKKFDKHVNLLQIQNTYFPKLNDYDVLTVDNDGVKIKYHYCWIKNISRLLSQQLNKSKKKVYLCDRCLNYFRNEHALIEHTEHCHLMNQCKISFPKYDFVEFKNYTNQQTYLLLYRVINKD